MTVSQAVAMATTNRKDNHFLLFSTYLLSFLELPSVKYFQTRQSSENDFGQLFNLKKMKSLTSRFVKILNFPIFDETRESPR